jgi:hypothetical protein
MQENNHLLEFARNELKLINFDQSELYGPILELLKQSSKVCNNDSETMKQIVYMLVRLIDREPLSPITELDFELEYHSEGNNTVTIHRCTRYPYVYSMGDGKYWNDRAVVFRFADSAETDKMYLYQSGNNSKQEITLPYFPVETVKIIERN